MDKNSDNPEVKNDNSANGSASLHAKYRAGELTSFLHHRSQFWILMQSYASRYGMKIDKNKIFGSLYHSIFFVGICSLRGITPSMKDIYLELEESRSTSLRHVEYLEAIGVFKRQPDPDDARRTSIYLASDFANDFGLFIDT